MLPRFLLDTFLRLTRDDLIRFIDDNQEALLRYFHEEIEAVDERIPEEQAFIDLHMAALGEELLKATLTAMKRFIQDYGRN